MIFLQQLKLINSALIKVNVHYLKLNTELSLKFFGEDKHSFLGERSQKCVDGIITFNTNNKNQFM